MFYAYTYFQIIVIQLLGLSIITSEKRLILSVDVKNSKNIMVNIKLVKLFNRVIR